MINVSTAWQRALYDDKRDFLEKVKITLSNGTILNLTNENIWGGVKIDDATSNDGDFEVGAAIVNKLSFNINNIYGDFDAYDFNNAYVEVSIGLTTDTSTEYIKKGEFTVNSATYNGSLINIECYDNMFRFDRPYSESTLIYPTTLDLIVRDACTKCGVTLASLNFPHKNYVISEKPSEKSTTFREVIAWSAQIAGCFARCNVDGDLELKWYDQASIGDGTDTLDGGIFDDGTPTYSTGDTADGGTFNPWNTGYAADGGVFTDRRSVHYISSLYSKNISVDDVIITGVRIVVKTDNTSVMHEELVGTTGYVVEISGNPMITTTNVHEIAVWLGNQLIGFKFRKAQITHGSNPAIEAGDVAFILDGKGNSYPIVISHTVFTVGSSQSTISSAQTPARNSSTRYNAQTKNYVEMRKAVQEEKTAREAIEDELSTAIQNAAGLYTTVVTDQETGKSTYYLHNKNNLNESAVRLMFSDAGITVTADGGENWYGLTVSGTMLVNLLATTGLHADWINAGQLVVSKNGQETFFVDVDTGAVRIVADSFSLRSGRTIDGAYTNGDNKATAAQNAAIQASNNYTDGKITTVNQAIDNIQQQIDGEVDFYYYDYVPTMNNIPASDWTGSTAEETEQIRKSHEGDTFLHISTGQTYRFLKLSGQWQWSLIQDSGVSQAMRTAQEALTNARSKVRAFTQEPVPPYEVGDMWLQGSSGDLLVCQTSKTATGDTYSRSDWAIATKYTDDTAFTTWKNGEFATTLADLQTGIRDAKIETFYQSNDPSTSWTTQQLKLIHEGDIWCNSSTQKSYRYNGNAWQEMKTTPPQEVLDKVDGKATIYVGTSTPANPSGGDLWFKSQNDPILTYVNGQWVEYNKYTDNSYLTNWLTNTYAVDKQGLQNQIDGKVETFYQTTNPATSWTATEKASHVGDLWYNSTSNVQKYYRWNGSVWSEMTATPPDEVFDRIDGKAQVFVGLNRPTPPYMVGDLWFNSTADNTGEIFTCVTSRTSGSGYESDWKIRNKYTDNSELESYKSTVDGYVRDLQNQIDGHIMQWFANEAPTLNNYPANTWSSDEDKRKHIDDLCYNKVTGKVYRFAESKQNLKITYSGNSETEGVNWDYAIICYEYEGKKYQTPKVGGRGSSNTIANAVAIIPTSNFQIFWRTDSSNANYYGFKISSMELVYEDLTTASEVSSFPSYTTSETVSAGTLPESAHNGYGDNVQKMFFCDSGQTIPSTATFMWLEIQDEGIRKAMEDASDALDTADSKRRVFVSDPIPPYDVGDLWAQGTNGDILRCVTARTEGQQYDILSDWAKASKYTDDSYITSWINGTYATDKGALQDQIDGKIETFSQTSDPSNNWTSAQKSQHTGDLWYNPSSSDQKYRRWNGSSWTEITATPPSDIQTIINNKANIFTGSSRPTPPYKVGDLWFSGTTSGTGEIYTCVYSRTSGSGSSSDWEIRNKYAAYAESLISDFDLMLNQNEVLSRLVNGGDQIYLQDGKLYILASAILGDILKMGGRNNANGEIEVYNSSGTRIGLWNMNGLFIGNISGTSKNPTGANTKIATNGDISTQSLTAENYIYVDGDHHSAFNIKINGTSYSDYVSISDDGFKGFVEFSSSSKAGVLIASRMSMKHSGNTHGLIAYNGTYSYVPSSQALYLDYDGLYLQSGSESSSSLVSRFQQGTFVVSNGSKYLFSIFDDNHMSNFGQSDGYLTQMRFYVSNVYMQGGLSVSGTKKRIASTKDYSNRSLYCYEMPSPMFGDVGEGVIGTDGLCYVNIDPIFAETISTNQYQVFLQAYGDGKCFVKERKSSYFVVQGEPNLPFGWEIKAKQADFTQMRLDIDGITDVNESGTTDYVTEAINHINTIRSERNVE